MLPFIPYPLLGGIALLVPLLVRLRRRGPAYLVRFSLFWAYLLALVGATLFPLPILYGLAEGPTWANAAFTLAHVNLIPFYYGTNVTAAFLLPEIIKNILLTLPFGFGVSFIARLRPRDFLWLAPATGLVLELAQLLVSLAIGGPYRSVDINDVLLNAAGVWLGYGLYRLSLLAAGLLVKPEGIKSRTQG
ncbi:MAG TPA: VanZ family protein [Anaerolineales bacterium]|nr:VanZ family protein [Anaerolineales bacterium]